MNCQDFERIWDDLLDAGRRIPGRRESAMESPEPTSREQDLTEALREHALGCPECLIRMRSYETLRQAIQSWHHAPKAAPSTDLADRILAAVADENARLIPFRNRRLWQRGWTIGLAATAAAALAIVIYPRHDRSRPLPNAPGPERSIARIEPETNPKPKPTTPAEVDLPALNQALTDASDATWDLAYAASGPAVRLGRQVFDRPAGSGPSRSPDEPGPSSRPGIFPAEAPGEVVSDALSRFGKEISEGVRPLSDSALRAINFLQRAVPSPVPAIETPPPMSDSKGA